MHIAIVVVSVRSAMYLIAVCYGHDLLANMLQKDSTLPQPQMSLLLVCSVVKRPACYVQFCLLEQCYVRWHFA